MMAASPSAAAALKSACLCLDRLVVLLVRVAEYLTLAIAFFITGSMILGVLFRFALNSSIIWTDEVSSLLLSVMMFLVIGIGLHERIHIGVDVLFDRLTGAARTALDVGIQIVSAGFFLTIMVGGLRVVEVGFGMQLATVELSRGLFQMAAPVGAAFAFIVCINNVLHVVVLDRPPRIDRSDQ